VWDTGLALLEGRFRDAEQGAHDALLLGRRLGHPFAGACFRGQICLLDRERGRDQAVVTELERHVSRTSLGATHWTAAVLGRAAAASGDTKRARSILDNLARSGFRDIARSIRWNGTIAEIALLATELEAAEQARPLIELIEPTASQHGLLPVPINYAGPLARCLAGLWSVLGVADEAIAYYDQALESTARIGARPTLAWTGLEAARVLARAGRGTRAAELLRESEALSVELGMPRLTEEARRARARIGR
jgi:hypothetical protein